MSTHPLLFVKDLAEKAGPRGNSRTFWAPDCAGLDYLAACNLGEELALEAVQYMRAENLAPLLGWAVMEMPDYRSADDAQKGAMVGFLSVFAHLAMAAATPERLVQHEHKMAEFQAFMRRLAASTKANRRRPRRRAA